MQIAWTSSLHNLFFLQMSGSLIDIAAPKVFRFFML